MTAFDYCTWKKPFGVCMAGLTYVMLALDLQKGTLGEGPYGCSEWTR